MKEEYTMMTRRSLLKLTGMTAGMALGSPLSVVSALADDTPRYRTLKSGLRLSTVGIGGGTLQGVPQDEVSNMTALALDNGINFIDMLIPRETMENIARAIQGRRDRFVTQMHLGALYRTGQYERSRNLRLIRESIEEQVKAFGGYSDIGMLHYIDDVSDFERVMNDGLFEYAVKLKQDGVIRHLGFSSHSVDIARRFLETGAMDVFMFSVNPAYDFDASGGNLTASRERMSLYQESARRGVGIVCMKTYAGGRLLNDQTSPFQRALTPAQCIQYCLDRPAVVSCPVGVGSVEELQAALTFYSASRAERDYAFIGGLQSVDVEGTCVYCNHCLPCPANIDIGAAVKYYDLALTGDDMAKDHYRKLAHTADDCIYCGVCEKNCPFHVGIMDTMGEMKTFFAQN